jgi:hypothetical protein
MWDVTSTVNKEVSAVVLHFLNIGEMDPSINLPKVNSLACVTDFRPISLCNVLYKLISKILANRLKAVLPYIIYSTQVLLFLVG